MMPLTQRRCPARAPHRPEQRTSPSTAPARAPHQPERPRHSAWNRRGSQPKAPAVHRLARARYIWNYEWSRFSECGRFGVARTLGLVSVANLELIDTEVCRAQQTRSHWNPPRAQRSKSGVMRDVPTPSAANRELRHGERCKSGVIGTPSAAHLELSSASAADMELRPPAEAVNSISAALDTDNSIFAALSESRLRVTPDMQR